MNQYNLTTEEITRVIALYSKITSPEKRIYAQGYLNGLSVVPSISSTECGEAHKNVRKASLQQN